MDEKFKNDEMLSDEALDEVSGGNIVQTMSMLSILNDLGVPGIPENLRLEGGKLGISVEASNKLSEILESYGAKMVTIPIVDNIIGNIYYLKNDSGSYTQVGADAVISHIKSQILAQTTVSI